MKRKNYNLTSTEKEIYNLIVIDGMFKKEEIARYLYVSVSTIKTHFNNIYNKLNVHNVAELLYKHYKGLQK